MGWRWQFLIVVGFVVAFGVQSSVLTALRIPGATPDLILVLLVAVALASGPIRGAVTGFVVGCAVDVLPPSDTGMGRWAFVWCIVGYGVGLLRSDMESSVVLPIVVTGVAALGGLLLFGGLGALVSDPRASWGEILRLLPTTAIYDVLLAPFVIPPVLAAERRWRGADFRGRPGW
jgi:rod shape-determining protein MreD